MKQAVMLECHQTLLCTGSKVAKRLAQTILPWELCSPSSSFIKAYWTASEKTDPRAQGDPLNIVCIHKPEVLHLGLYGITSYKTCLAGQKNDQKRKKVWWRC